MTRGTGTRVQRRPAARPLPPWLAALAGPQAAVEVLAPAGERHAAVEDDVLDALEAVAGARGSQVLARIEGSRDATAWAAAVAGSTAGVAILAAAGRHLVVEGSLAALRPLLEGGGAPGRRIVAVAAEGPAAEAVGAALCRGDARAAAATGRLTVVHDAGDARVLLVHDPGRSSIAAAAVAAEGSGAAGPPLVAHRRGRRLAVGAAAVAVTLAAAALAVAGVRRSAEGPPATASPEIALGALSGRHGGAAPPPRELPATAVDVDAAVTLLMGGIAVGGRTPADLDDTWIWERGSWTLDPRPRIPARHGALMVPFGSAPDGPRFLLVGGVSAGATLHDAWIWAPLEGWTAVTPPPRSGDPVLMAAGPPGRGGPVLVLRDPGGQPQTAVFGGVAWRQSGAVTPALRLAAADGRDGVVGIEPGTLGAPGHTWRWTGSEWTRAGPATEPVLDTLTAMLTALPGHGLLLAQNPFFGVGGAAVGSYTFDGTDWRRASDPGQGLLRPFDSTAPVWGVEEGRMVIIGGDRGADAYRYVEAWTGAVWVPE